MILDDVTALAEELRKAEIEFVVVGGASLERKWPIRTGDIDVAVTMKDYSNALKRLHDHPRFKYIEDQQTIAGSKFLVGTRLVDVEFINPKMFSGKRPPDEFIDYIRRHRSHSENGIVFADPEVVWYMRLATESWTVYVSKITRDVRAGVPPEKLLDQVVDIAKYLGNLDVIAPRVRETRRMLGLLSLSSGRGRPQTPKRV